MSGIAFLGPPAQAPAGQTDYSIVALVLSLVAIFLVFYHHHIAGGTANGAVKLGA